MHIGLIDVDGIYANLAIMKLSAWHKARGDSVNWFDPLFGPYDTVYASKVFTYTPDYDFLPPDVIRGGTGYKMTNVLPDEIEHTYPDYQLYNLDHSVGFLTRGCLRACPHCVVPTKEGKIRANADVTEFLQHDAVCCYDNNVLASPHGLQQIEKMAKLKLKVDFTQGIDARLVDAHNARLLAALKWLRPLTLACDSQQQKHSIALAVPLLRAARVTPSRYKCYMIVWNDIDEAHDRAEFLRTLGVTPYAQPFRDTVNDIPISEEQQRFARWVNHKPTWCSIPWSEYTG